MSRYTAARWAVPNDLGCSGLGTGIGEGAGALVARRKVQAALLSRQLLHAEPPTLDAYAPQSPLINQGQQQH